MSKQEMLSYSVSIDEASHTASAVDKNGAVIVSLMFQNYEELCSNEFQASLRDAVALASLDYAEENTGEAIDEEYIEQDLIMVMWEEQMHQKNVANDLMNFHNSYDEQQIRSLADYFDRQELEEKIEDEKRDHRFALELQMQEEKEAMSETALKRNGKLSGADKNGWSQSNPWRTLYKEDASLSVSEAIAFPPLPEGTNSEQASICKPTRGIIDEIKIAKESRPLHIDEFDSEIAQVMKDWKQASHISTKLDARQLNSIGADDRNFIMSAASIAITKEERNIHTIAMEKSSNLSTCGPSTLLQDPTVGDLQSGVDRDKYSRKNIRKLVLDMFHAGWMPLRRGGGHYIYERIVKIPNLDPLRQVLVLPSTPSSQKSIDRVYAKLIKYDREVAEKLVAMNDKSC